MNGHRPPQDLLDLRNNTKHPGYMLDINRLARRWVWQEHTLAEVKAEMREIIEFWGATKRQALDDFLQAEAVMQRVKRLARQSQEADHLRITGHLPGTNA